MIDHIGLLVTDFDKSKNFYKEALSAINYSLMMELPKSVTGTTDVAGFGAAPKPDFWISKVTSQLTSVSPVHVAFSVSTRAQVDSFYQHAIKAGGRDNGAPGIRAHYHPNYYGAFVLDPDGHNIEAVCHLPS